MANSVYYKRKLNTRKLVKVESIVTENSFRLSLEYLAKSQQHIRVSHISDCSSRESLKACVICYITYINPTPPDLSWQQVPLNIVLGCIASRIPLLKWIGLIIKYYFQPKRINNDLVLLGICWAAFPHKCVFYIQSFKASSFYFCYFVYMDWNWDNKCMLDKHGGEKKADLFK